MPVPFARRDFLRAVVAVAGPGVVGACGEGGPTATSQEGAGFFPQSIASGDPRPTSVVLWTRVEDESAGPSVELLLEVALDEAFVDRVELGGSPSLALRASSADDYCVKARVEALESGTYYHYRFSYLRGGERHVSRTGRTRTAPAADADLPVRFAVVTCQDYGGKYYHVFRHLVAQDPDFVVHLGDYVYETVDDPEFQDPTPERVVRFRHPEQALVRGGAAGLAARSVDNYRDLYRTCRSDADLQRMHELFPMIAVWDDHEFSNDCFGANATYTGGREREDDLERRRAADRAWFEYMPVDYAEAPAREFDESAPFPEDLSIYRSFVFGRHLELVMTDLRRFKPDHLVPEEALPGAVFLEETAALELLGALPDDAVPYVDIDALSDSAYRDAIRGVAPELGFDADTIGGFLSLPWVNQVLATAGISEPAPLDEADPALPRGYAYHQLLKSEQFAALGARYLVARRPFSALAAQRFAATEGASERIMGIEQRSWFVETLQASTRTWKVWGNEYTLMPRVIDLTAQAFAPPEFRVPVQLSADDWDGAPNERDRLLRELAPVENLVVVTGDLHAFLAGTPHPAGDPAARVVEFVAGSVSSNPWLPSIQRLLEREPNIPPGVAALAQAVASLLTDREQRPNPHLGWLDLSHNGYALVSANGGALETTLYMIHTSLVATPPGRLSGSLDSRFEATRFRVISGTRDLEQNQDGVWRRWDMERMAWV